MACAAVVGDNHPTTAQAAENTAGALINKALGTR